MPPRTDGLRSASPPRALLLDLDDTILDSRSSLRLAWHEVSRAVSTRLPELAPDAVREQIGRSTRWYWSDPERVQSGRVDLPRARREILEHVLTALGRPHAELAAETARLYTRIREERLELLPGAIDALERLRARVGSLGLVTNGAAPVQRAKIERFRLAGYFDAIVVEGELGIGKPDARVFAHALAALGAPAGESWMAGDDYEADVAGALAAGLEAVWIEPDGRSEPPSRLVGRSPLIVRSLLELAERLEG